MRLTLGQSIDLILSLPAHRSDCEPHRNLGENAFRILLDYREAGDDDNERAYNREVICCILAATRAFSIERERVGQEWEMIEVIKERRNRLMQVVKNMSPFEKGNYWSKFLSLLGAFGLALGGMLRTELDGAVGRTGIIAVGILMLAVVLLSLEVFSKVIEFLLSTAFARQEPLDKEKAWKQRSTKRYKEIVRNFIDKWIAIHAEYFPDNVTVAGYRISKSEELEGLKRTLVERHFFY